MLSEEAYRRLLRLYPRAFREAYEEDMLALFRHLRARSTRGALARRILADVIVSAPREWLRRLRRPPRAASTSPRRKGRAMTGLLRDARLALRCLGRQPGTTLLAAATLAVGFGTSLAIFTAVNGVLLHPLPYPDAERIVRLWANHHEDGVERFSFTKIELRAYLDESESFEALGGDFPIELTLTGGDGEPERLAAALTTPGYLEVYGARPIHGRTFTFEDIEAGDPRVAILSHGLWQRRFGSDPKLVGRVIQLDGRPFTVLGVLPPEFRHVTSDTDVFIPHTLGTEGWIGRWLELSARLKPGVSLFRAQAELEAMAAALAEEHERSRGWSMTLEPLLDAAVGSARFAMWAALGAALLLFCLAAVNVLSLFLARAVTSQSDVDLRAALGAGPLERVRQSTLESFLVSAVGLAAGAGLARALTPRLLQLGVDSLPRLSSFEPDLRVHLFGSALAVSSLLALTSAPVAFAYLRSRRRERRVFNGASSRGGSGLSPRSARILAGLVVAETALAVAILSGAGLLMRSYYELLAVDPGYQTTETVAMSVALPRARYPEAQSRLELFERFEARLSGLPGTTSASLAAYLPLEGRGALSFLNSEARVARGEPRVSSLQRVVSPSFFRTLRIPLLRGDTFDPRPAEDAPQQVVLGAALARQLFGEEDPVGKRVTSSETPGPSDWRVVRGVVGDVRYLSLAETPQTQFYEPYAERAWGTMKVVVHTRDDAETFVTAARQVLTELDSDVPISEVVALDSASRRAVARPRFNMTVFSVFAAVALTLALAGIYGVLSFVTARRTKEIGVRMAFGASKGRLTGAFVARAASLTAAGTCIGLAAAALAFRGLSTLLFGVAPFDPITAASVAALLVITAALASYLPARRASEIDPVTALGQD